MNNSGSGSDDEQDGRDGQPKWTRADSGPLLESEYDGVDVSKADVNNLYTASRDASVVVWKDSDGTVHADGPDGAVVPAGTNDVTVAQAAYDAAFGEEKHGRFVFAPATWEFDDSFVHYQSGVAVSAPGATFTPDGDYSGYLFEWKTTDDTITGDPENLYDSYLREIHVDGRGQAKGIYMELVLSSELGPNVYLYDTAGPALRVANTIRHVNFWGPHIRYGGSPNTAALEIGPERDVTGEGDASNHNAFYGLHNVFPTGTAIRIFNEDSLNDLNPVRGFKFFGGQWHGNPTGSYGRADQTDPLVEILGAANIAILGPNIRNSGGSDNGVIHIGQGNDGRRAADLVFDSATAISSEEGFGIRIEPEGLTGELVLDSVDIGQWGHVPNVIDWGDGDYVCKWGSVMYEYTGSRPFEGTPPRIVGREPDRDVLCGWCETWVDGRGTRRTNGRVHVRADETHDGDTPDYRHLSPVPRYDSYRGDPQFERDGLLLDTGDGVRGDIEQLFTDMSWDMAFQCVSDPEEASVRFWPFFDATDAYGWRVALSHDGTYTLGWVDTDGGEDVLLSESVAPLGTGTNNLQVRRTASEEWTLSWNGTDVGSVTDGRMPAGRNFVLSNELDTRVEIGDIIAY